MKYCSNCGGKINNERHCVKCDAKLDENAKVIAKIIKNENVYYLIIQKESGEYDYIERVSYNTPNKNASGTNTTQWDYEGYLGFKNAGKGVTGNDGLYLQFPKGKLLISSQSTYEQIRGTVVFFDLDNRASNDFE